MRTTLLCLLLAAGLFTACKNNTSSEKVASAKDTVAKPQSNLGQAQTSQLMDVLAAYYSLKDALVASNNAQADAAASKLLSATELFNHDLSNLPQSTEMHPQLQGIMNGCDSLIAAKGDTLEQKRGYFANISGSMFKTLQLAGLRNGKVYQEFCPMAFNNKGAYWLSAESEIKNPYFGKKMLECGDVKDSL